MKIFIPIAILIASIGLFFTFISPQYKAMADLRNQSAQYDDAIDRAKKVVAKRDDLVAAQNSFSQDDINHLVKFLPDSIDTIQLIIDTNSLATASGAVIQGIKVTQDDPKANPTSPVASAQLSFSVKMTYDQLQQLLQSFEHSLRLTDISSITFTPTDDGSAYTFNVTVRTYWLKP